MSFEFNPGDTVNLKFNTHEADGTPITLADTPVVSIYKQGSTTESTAGVTLSVDYDSRTGLHNVSIDTSADGSFYSAGSSFSAVITTGTVDGISVVGTVVGSFLIREQLTAANAAEAVRTELTTELGRIDADISSRAAADELAKVPKKDVTYRHTNVNTSDTADVVIEDIP